MTEDSLNVIYVAPLQGFTDHVFRRNFHRIFGGATKYFCPYISFDKPGQIKKSALKDVLPVNNEGLPVIPQVLFSDVDEFRELCQVLIDLGYPEINLNLGCPYPMAAKRGRGVALMENIPAMSEVFAVAESEFPSVRFSVKLRSGYQSEDEIFAMIDLLNQVRLEEVIYHPRVAGQLYKGATNLQLFHQVKAVCKHSIFYNGDICNVSDILDISQIASGQDRWMIGRGVLQDPFLLNEIHGKAYTLSEKRELKQAFHDSLLQDYSSVLQGGGHLLQKMEQFWSYFSEGFSNPHKAFKLVKKASSIGKYNEAVIKIFSEY